MLPWKWSLFVSTETAAAPLSAYEEGQGCRVEVGPEQALGRGGPLYLGDHAYGVAPEGSGQVQGRLRLPNPALDLRSGTSTFSRSSSTFLASTISVSIWPRDGLLQPLA